VSTLTAAEAGFLACHACGLVHRPAAEAHDLACARCGAGLHFRAPNSIARSWALLIAAYVLIVPANLLPVMETGSLFGSETDTIMSGVIYLWTSGSWPLALIVFFASIAVPFSKLAALT
jgi:paraquat-inducible protein A